MGQTGARLADFRQGRFNLVVIVLDSLRFDIAAKSQSVERLGSLHECEAAGSYTLPAHASLFSGTLPLPKSGRYAFDGFTFQRIFRNSGARPNGTRPLIEVSGPSLIQQMSRTHRVKGFGGVPFFDPLSSGFTFAPEFPEFTYEGYPSGEPAYVRYSNPSSDKFVLRTARQELGDLLEDPAGQPFFLFVNEPATHFPYECAANALNADDMDSLLAVEDLSNSKLVEPSRRRRQALGEWAMGRQTSSFEVCVDAIVDMISDIEQAGGRPLLLIVMSDHGEAMGEYGRFGHGFNEPNVNTVPLWARLIK